MTPQKIRLTVISEDLLTITQAADELGVHLATAYRWVDKGKLNAFRIGDQVFVTVDQINAIKQQRKLANEDSEGHTQVDRESQKKQAALRGQADTLPGGDV